MVRDMKAGIGLFRGILYSMPGAFGLLDRWTYNVMYERFQGEAFITGE